MKNRTIFLMCIISFLIYIQFFLIVNAYILYDQTEKDLPTRGYAAFGMNIPEDNFPIRITVASTEELDLFVVNQTQYWDFLNKTAFLDLTEGAYLGITYASFEITLPLAGPYWAIIDNTDTHGSQSVGMIEEIRIMIEVFEWETDPPFGPLGEAPDYSLIIIIVFLTIIPALIIVSGVIYQVKTKKKPRTTEAIEKPIKTVHFEQQFVKDFSTDDLKFDVIPPGVKWLWIIVIFVFLFIGLNWILNLLDYGSYSLFDLIISLDVWSFVILLTPLIAILVWSQLGIPFAERIITKSAKNWKESKKLSIFLRILGLRLDPNSQYYLEAVPNDFNMKKVYKLFRERMIEIIAISLGVTVILTRIILIVNPPDWSYILYQDEASSNKTYQLMISWYLTLISPILIFWIVPIIWIAEDIHVSGMREDGTIQKLKDHVRSGILAKILGLAGIFLLFDTILGLNEELYPGDILRIYYLSFFNMLWFLTMSCALPFIIGIFYFRFFHKKGVNRVRKKIYQILPVGTTSIKGLGEIDQSLISQAFGEEEKIKFFDKLWPKICLLLMWYFFLIVSIWILYFI